MGTSMQEPRKHSPENAGTKRRGLRFGGVLDSMLSWRAQPHGLRALALSLIAVAGAVGAGLVLWRLIGANNIGLVFLTAVVGIAVRFGLWPSLAASVVSSLCYNFFFTAPYYTFTIDEPANIVSVIFFTIVAIIVSNVAAYARVQGVAAIERARTTELLYTFSRKLAGTGTLDDVLWATAYQTALMLNVRVVLLLPEGKEIAVKAGYPPEDQLDGADLTAARWAWQNDSPAGRGSDMLPEASRLFLPMRTGRGVIGVVGVDGDRNEPLLSPAERRLLEALTDQSALAIERVHLVEDMERVKRTIETERLRSALLTSISHDLRTPLAAVLGAAGTLRDLADKLNNEQKADLLSTVIDESERLNRFIANLLDMTKLEAGAVVPNTARHDLHEVIGSVLRRTKAMLASHKVELNLADNLPMVDLDAVLFEQVLFNLLDNAAKYASVGTTIAILSDREGDSLLLQVLDEGAGIPAPDLDHVFDKFYRAQKGDSVRAGTGLGLAISRGFIEAMHGSIIAGNRTDCMGAVFSIRLPVPAGSERLGEAA